MPARSGLPLRSLHLARALAREIDLELVAVADRPAPPATEAFPVLHLPGDASRAGSLLRSAWQPWSVAQIRSRALERHVRAGRWHVIQGQSLSMARYAAAGSAPWILDADLMTGFTQTIARTDSRAAMRALWRLESVKTHRFEAAVARAASAVSVPTEREAELFERLGARRVAVVPNGIDLAATPHQLPAAGAAIIFVGLFRWRPNFEAALELTERILPRVQARVPTATLTLVGEGAPGRLRSRAGAGVSVTGQVESVLPHLREARAAVMPLRAGGGTRIKALEALAAGVPVVATPFAVAGLGLRDGVDVLVAESWRDLADQVVRVIEDDSLARSLSLAGRRLVEDRFDWKTVARPLIQLHQELASTA